MPTDGIFRITDDFNYRRWVQKYDTIEHEQLGLIAQKIKSLPKKPHIAIVPLTVGVPATRDLSDFVRGLKSQIYENWRLCQPMKPGAILSVLPLTNAAANADFILPLPLDARLPAHALAMFVLALAEEADADIVYADEDFLRNGRRTQPHFKTDWDPYFILGRNYVGFPVLYRSDAIRRADLRDLVSRTVDNLLHSVTLRLSETAAESKILHIPSVLCHRTRGSDWDGMEARRHVFTHLTRSNFPPAEIAAAPLAPQWNRVRFSRPEPAPLVSIIVPTRDRADLIGLCSYGILNGTKYPALELIIVDNGTSAPDALALLEALKKDGRVKIIRDDLPFNYSRLNNLAAREARGDILALMNNDIEITHADWLNEMVSLAAIPSVGIVGARLLYPDHHIQHAGVTFGPDKLAIHQMRLAPREEAGPQGELALLRSVSAVTAACIAVRKNVFFEIGGFNEKDLKVACNDIDLCRRIAKRGYRIVWTPSAELTHHECATRGQPAAAEKAAREEAELASFWTINPEFFESPDPFHNPQIEFKHECVDFAWPPRPHRFRSLVKKPQESAFLY